MRRRRRVSLAALGATAAVGALAAALLTAPTAMADVAGPYFATQGLASDPHVIRCVDPATQINGYCLYTSRDMGQQHAYPPLNYYPMEETRLYYSENGYSGWVSKGVVFHENTIESANLGWVPNNAYHLWAPSAVKSGSYYYLYVPDVDDNGNPGIHTTSRIAVARSTSPFGPYSLISQVSGYPSYVSPASGYMSDPEVFVEGANRYLIWADGDYSNCGGFKVAKLNSDMWNLTPNTTQTLTITNAGMLGNCGGMGRPYMEGASLFKFNDPAMPGPYTLVFAAKPSSLPEACTQAWAGIGNAGTTNEVIAYATASTPLGPYNYQGILTCGSTTEWTNQGTIMQVNNSSGNARWVLVYHDSAADIKERRLHAECLFAGNGRIAGVYRQPLTNADGFNDCMANVDAGYSAYAITIGLMGGKNTTLMSAVSGGSQPLAVNRTAAGPWERFREYTLSNGNVAYRSMANGKYICASGQNRLQPSCTSSSDVTAQFVKVVSGNTFKLKAAATGYWIRDWYYYTTGLHHLQPWSVNDSGDGLAAVFTELEL